MTLSCKLIFVVSDDDGVIVSRRKGKERASINNSSDESDPCSKCLHRFTLRGWINSAATFFM